MRRGCTTIFGWNAMESSRAGPSRAGRASIYAKRSAETLAAEDPERFSAEAAKPERGGRIFVDWLRNQRGATAILPYSTRTEPSAPVAMPLAWDDLDAVGSSQAFTVRRVLDEGCPAPRIPSASAQRLPPRKAGR